MFKFFIGLLAISTIVPGANAACFDTSCKGKGSEVVRSIYPNGTGNIYLEAPSDKANLNCTLIEGHFMVLQSDHPLFKEMYSTIVVSRTGWGKKFD